MDNKSGYYFYREGINEGCSFLGKRDLYFTDMNNWTKWIKYSGKIMVWMWDCEPIGRITSYGKYYKSKKFILSNPRCIWMNKELRIDIIRQYGLSYLINESPIDLAHFNFRDL
jgi:hypothetical protein